MAEVLAPTTIILLIIFCCKFQSGTGAGGKLKEVLRLIDRLKIGDASEKSTIPSEANIVMDNEGNNMEWWSNSLSDAIGVYAMRAKRPSMEDRYSITVKGEFLAFAVFDGHGGESMSKHAAKHLLKAIIYVLERETSVDNFKELIQEAIARFNEYTFRRKSIPSSSSGRYAGSTAVIGVVHKEKLYIANVGDSRAVAIHSNREVERITKDHKADDVEEGQRIAALGGKIWYSEDGLRLGGQCAVTRALGDYHLIQYGMTAEADVFVFDLETTTIQYVLLATDGVWDMIKDKDAAKTIIKYVKDELLGSKQLAEKAVAVSGHDNVTVMVVKLAEIRAWLRQVACDHTEGCDASS